MRNWLVALVLLLAALGLTGCPTAYEKAYTEINRMTVLTQQVGAANKTLTTFVMAALVVDERLRREEDLTAASCTGQAPPTMTAPCQAVWDAAGKRYEARSRDLAARARGVDDAAGLLLASLRLAVTTLGEWQAGLAGEIEWRSVLQRALGLLADMQRVYAAYKTFCMDIKGGTP
jgi:hypothetical protein